MNHCTYSTDCHDCVSYQETLLDISHVNLSYGEKVVLRDIDFKILDVERKCHVQGQVVGILGPSGIGKTQLFRIIAGLNQPTSGGVFINSTHDPVKAGMVGVVSQGYTLFEHRTVLGNLMLGATKKYPKKEAHDRSATMLESLGLPDKAEVYPALLSGGQRQRVAIAQQLLCSDHFIMMDEPTASLDFCKKEELGKLIGQVACMDTLNTVIICSHDIDWLCSVVDHLMLLGREPGLPGARVVEEYDLVKAGLCWQENISTRPDFVEFVRTVKERFRTL